MALILHGLKVAQTFHILLSMILNLLVSSTALSRLDGIGDGIVVFQVEDQKKVCEKSDDAQVLQWAVEKCREHRVS